MKLNKFSIEDDCLACPNCGLDVIHHNKVEVFARQEDAGDGLHVKIDDIDSGLFTPQAVIDSVLEGNPSARRGAIKISFFCEGCSYKPVLTLIQHKGITKFGFE